MLQTSIAAAADDGPPPATPCKPLWLSPNPSTPSARSRRPGRTSGSCSIHLRGSFGASEQFANRVLATGAAQQRQTAILSAREITVLGLLPSMLSLEEIALDLTVSVNTVKSHLRSIYMKLGVSSLREKRRVVDRLPHTESGQP